MREIFFNERRLRAGWRILLFLSLCYLLLLLLSPLLLALFPGLETADPADLRNLLLDGFFLLPLLLISWLLARYIDHRPFASLGLGLTPSWEKELFLGFSLGIAMGATFLSIGLLSGVVRLVGRGEATWRDLAILILGFLLAAGFEEILFHGYPFQALIEGIGVYPALFVISIVFSLFHHLNPYLNLIGSINIGLAGLLLALGYVRTRALWLPIGLHFSWNLFQILFSFPVSGLRFLDGPFQADLQGPELLSGGGFGPEGSLIATAVFAGAIAFLALSPWVRPRPAMERLWKEYIRSTSLRG
ncbi:TPA: CPBP family intramembrane metalloprotease [Candidatus Bipolaricaulota bacterium]|nr:CPBP family intramembrane metalloprotease [Candidatus Bipolaricaulota bacterium]